VQTHIAIGGRRRPGLPAAGGPSMSETQRPISVERRSCGCEELELLIEIVYRSGDHKPRPRVKLDSSVWPVKAA
jgi:hypothetical protein